MSESEVLSVDQQRPIVHLKDYQVPNYLIDDIHLTFDLHAEYTLVKSRMQIQYNPASTDESDSLLLSGDELTLVSIKIDGKQLSESDYHLTETHLTVLNVPDKFELEIETKIYPQKNTALSGLYCSRGTFCTQCEAEGFRRITFFLDRPDVLARYTTTIIADTKRYPMLLSNGNLIDSGKVDAQRHFATWQDPFKKPSYLFALVAGDFDLLEDTFVTSSGRKVDIRIYVEKGFGEQSHHALYCLKEAMRWDEIAYGREYDLDIFMIVAITDFNMGAMENKGLNIFNTKYILAKPETATDTDYIHILSVVGHEYFHNWSGNRVTCRDWFQLSLKEGLTIFRDQSFSEDVLSRPVMRIHDVTALRETQFPEDAGPLAHAVRPTSYMQIDNFYTATIYNKGAEVLRMLQTILGKEKFRKGMDLYFAQHDGQAATIDDLLSNMETVSAVDLTQFKLWYSQAGTPEVTVEADYDAKKHTYTLKIKQQCPATPGDDKKLPMHIPIRTALLDSEGKAIPLHLNDYDAGVETVLHLTEPEQIFCFADVKSKPIPSLLRHFSAPVKLKYAYSDEDFIFLSQHDNDLFNRWEACQKYLLKVLLHLVHAYHQKKELSLPTECIQMLGYALKAAPADRFFAAEMLVLPSEQYIGEQMQIVDPDAIHAAREFVSTEIAAQLENQFLDTYRECNESGPFKVDMVAVGKRQLKNRCLSYLALLPKHANLLMQQFNASLKTNMTDCRSALSALANLDIEQRKQALDAFYATWKQEALVVDKWFAIQAASKLPDALAHVMKLMHHEAFDIKNPNKVYALIGMFCHHNLAGFHAKMGEGYAFLAEFVNKLDKLNPQIASKMVKPLTDWKRYDKDRQKLMRHQLEWLLRDKSMSSNLYEIVSKSLAD